MVDNWVVVKPAGCTCQTWWQRECCMHNCDAETVRDADRFLQASWVIAGIFLLAACVALFYAGGLLGSD